MNITPSDKLPPLKKTKEKKKKTKPTAGVPLSMTILNAFKI
jgi:hypothetical protein